MTPLNGLRVLNTRPLKQGLALNTAISEAGGVAIHLPALVIQASNSAWLNTMPCLNAIKQAIFTSVNAVDYYFAALNQHHIPWPSSIHITAVGSATAKAIAKQGLSASYSSIADSEHLLEHLQHQIKNEPILLIKGEGGRALIAETLIAQGARLYELAVYYRAPPVMKEKDILFIWQNRAVDIILFTSHEAMHNVFRLFGKHAHRWLMQTPCIVISERLAKIAREWGIKTVIISPHDAVINTLIQYNKGLTDDRNR